MYFKCSVKLLQEENSAKCNGSGNFTCGGCTCNDGFYGDTCECRGDGLDDLGKGEELNVCRRLMSYGFNWQNKFDFNKNQIIHVLLSSEFN